MKRQLLLRVVVMVGMRCGHVCEAAEDTVCVDHWSMPLKGDATWKREADMPYPAGHLAAAVLDGQIYALGGANGHDKKQVDQVFGDRYDPPAKQWKGIAKLPDGRSHFEGSTIVHEGRIVVVAGRCNSSRPARMTVSDIWEYNPKIDAASARNEPSTRHGSLCGDHR